MQDNSSSLWCLTAALLFAGATVHAEYEFRACCTASAPPAPVRIMARWGGEGLGGKVQQFELTRFIHRAPATGAAGVKADGLTAREGAPTDRVVVSDSTFIYHYLNPGVWSEWRPLSELHGGFVTFTLGTQEDGQALRECQLAFEIRRDGQVVRQFTVAGPDGSTFGVCIPRDALSADPAAAATAVAEVDSLYAYVQRKCAAVRAELGGPAAAPKLYATITDCFGYGGAGGRMTGRGCRTADRATMLAEYELLQEIGINSIRSGPEFIREMIRERQGLGASFTRAAIVHTTGYPIPMIHRADGRPPDVSPGDGCPSHPDNRARIAEVVEAAVARLVADGARLGADEVWAETVDEIGTVFDGAPEGKAHQGACPYCREAFREMIRAEGRTLADFGVDSWQAIRSTYGYNGRDYWTVRSERQAALAAAREAARKHNKVALQGAIGALAADPDDEVIDLLEEPAKSVADPAQAVLSAKERMSELINNPRAGQPPTEVDALPLSPSGVGLLRYYSARFNNEAAARLFQPLREALAAQNTAKGQALLSAPDSALAKQPWLYSYALRGNTFLLGGHSLDFFDFYRFADNAFVYETSNRDPRVWQWDSYLCDVGRSLQGHLDQRFGIYVKPHRGAPMQRALSAAARGARLIFWYTYGPEWAKGDSFGNRHDAVVAVGRTSRLLAAAEDVVYDADWAIPAEVALVRPLTSKVFGNSASWENGKWIHTALTHAHISVDALDETLLLSKDLSQYKAIYVSGSHLRRDVAARLAAWVVEGGTIYSCGGGLARDETDQPLDILLPVLGLVGRTELQQWANVPKYGATQLRGIERDAAAPEVRVVPSAVFTNAFAPLVGREILQPAAGAEVLATYDDGGAAVVRHAYGRGQAWTVGVYAGLEYATDIMVWQDYDPDKLSYVAAPALAAGVSPVVDAGLPTVEGVLLRNRDRRRPGVMLMNWRYTQDRDLVPAAELTIRLRACAGQTIAYSCALQQDLQLRHDGDITMLTLPSLDAGDILLLR